MTWIRPAFFPTLLSSVVLLASLSFAPAIFAEEAAEETPAAATPASVTEPVNEKAEEAPLGLVPRALFTKEVIDREPGEEVTELSTDERRIIFYTELRDLAGQRVIHRWEYKGKVVAEVPFDVGGPRWRVYSIKTLNPKNVGEWSASVVDAYGRVLSARSFSYSPASAPEKPEVVPEQAPEDLQ